ncbi:restriction endonuclease subunit S [Actinobacillus porcinus]|uniref:restriction endonuclease subunit S n=1 Tax=Actinobacillus porcinus TaxID=51048 RepID=UPI002355CA98|nr:restriction endonuclease subunit S [Actinobacillus porcinus]
MEFKKITVGNFAENLDRFRVPLSSAEREKKQGTYPYYGAAKIIDYVDGFTHSGLSVLIAEDGSVETDKGYPVVQLANGEYWVNNHTHVLKGKDDWDTLYLYYALQIIKVSPFVTGAVQKKISQKALNSMELNYFEDPMIRRKIVETLLGLDQKIQLNTQINQTLEQIAQTIFKSWFIDFDPVHAKAEALANGQTAEQATQAAMAVISGKNTQELHRLQTANPEQYQQLWEIAEAFPSGFDEEGVPRGWESKKVGEVAKIIKGKSYKSSELAPSKTALVTLKSFNRGGGYRLDGLKEYTGTYKPEQEVFAGDLIIAYTDVTQAADVIGKPAMVMSDSRYEHLVISLDVGVVRPKNEKYKYFLYCLAMTDTFQAHTHSFCTGTTVLHLGKEAVPSFEFILPDNKFIELFDEFVSPIFVRINNIIEENKSLEKIRDELLPKLLSGEIYSDGDIGTIL